ncbi:LOB domain-containing protein 1-like [Aristolochia californica]|uniref:LOB domain-containing protein 1-like n=1 Tax=Aristolochia californica TaxID=171875 RepID=UPI0035E10D27
MDASETTTTTTTTCSPFSSSPRSSSSSPPPSTPAAVVVSPCAACKILRRRCVEKCVLAPYFPPSEPHKFTTAHRVFGASNIIKFLQDLPESQRADAVSSMVYEANARIRDPVYGCAGAICQLQKQVSQLQAQLAKAQAEILNMRSQQESLIAIICSLASPAHSDAAYGLPPNPLTSNAGFLDDNTSLAAPAAWEQLWT